MDQTLVILAWLAIVSVVGLNGFAAGLAAMLFLWRSRMRRGARIVTASTVAGLLPASVFLPIMFTEPEFMGGEGALGFGIGFVVTLAVAGAVSLPGAILICRKLASPGDDYRAFE